VSSLEVAQWCKIQGEHVYVWESSMLDCFGLKGVKSFLNLPYLRLKVRLVPLACIDIRIMRLFAVQKEGLEAQLKKVNEDTASALEEVNVVTKEQTYEAYATSTALDGL